MPYRLVPDNISHDTVEALETLLGLAKQGEITGIAFVCTLPRSRYITDIAGHCYRHPTLARGMTMSLGDQLAALVHERDQMETR